MKYELYQSYMEEVDNHIRILEDFPPMQQPLVDHIIYCGIMKRVGKY